MNNTQTKSFTLTGSEQFHEKITSQLNDIALSVLSIIPERLVEGIILGGSYGRGEGGVVIREGGENIFNDYDLFIICKNISTLKRKKYNKELSKLSKELTKKYGFHVDFSPIQNISSLTDAPFWLIWYELKYGHYVIWGNGDVLDLLPTYNHKDVPIEEALKLLLNRGVTLVEEERILGEGEGCSPGNLLKVILACGDSLLMTHRLYHFRYTKRHERIIRLRDIAEPIHSSFIDLYQQAIDFKFKHDPKEYLSWDLSQLLTEAKTIYLQTLLNICQRYYCKDIITVDTLISLLLSEHIRDPWNDSVVKNIFLNLQSLGIDGLMDQFSYHYPRARLFASFFLWSGYGISHREEQLKALGLNKNATSSEIDHTFKILWERYN